MLKYSYSTHHHLRNLKEGEFFPSAWLENAHKDVRFT